MKLITLISSTLYVFFGVAFVDAEETQKSEIQIPPTPPQEISSEETFDEEWLNTVWTQVDDMVKEESLKLQKTVTVAGVRGAEAEDSILDKLYYKGAKRYPSQDKLRKAIDKLTEAVTKNPKGPNAAKQKFFIAQCYDKIGQDLQANDYYNQVASEHPNSRFANKAREHLSTHSTTR